MQIGFATDAIRRICQEPSSVLSDAEALVLERFLADLDAADTASDLEVLGFFPDGFSIERLAVPLGHTACLVCRFDHVPVQRSSDGLLRLDRLHRVMVVDIERTVSAP